MSGDARRLSVAASTTWSPSPVFRAWPGYRVLVSNGVRCRCAYAFTRRGAKVRAARLAVRLNYLGGTRP